MMRCPITAGFILIANSAFAPLVGGSAVPHESPALVSDDETSLLQAAATAKAGAAISGSGNAQTIARTAVCSDPESPVDSSVDGDLKPSHVPTEPDSAGAVLLESGKDEPDAALVSLIRQALWLLSLGIAANGAMRWQQQESAVPERAPAATTRARKIVDEAAAQRSALHAAALAGDAKRCQSLIREAPDMLTTADAWGTTALHAAATGGVRLVVELLLVRGAPVDPVNGSDETPLHLAAREGHVEVCELLVQRGASLRATNAEDQTPLVVAGFAEREAVCRALIALGAGVEGLPDEDLPSSWQLANRTESS